MDNLARRGKDVHFLHIRSLAKQYLCTRNHSKGIK